MLKIGIDDYVRALLDQVAAEEAFLDGLRQPEDAQSNGVAAPLTSAPSVSLMITNRQRAVLDELGFSAEAIRSMTPAEAHAHIGLTKTTI